MKIILDAMGGDNAPEAPVLGAVEAAKTYGIEIVLVGRGEDILAVLKKHGIDNLPEGMEISNADDVVDMHDDPASIIHKRKNSSMVIGLKMLADGLGDAFVSAGSTGALLTGATLLVKRVKGIRRAAMGPAMPNKAGGKTVIVDCGANAECRSEFLYQFGQMGSLYMNKIMKFENPKVALANNGEENTKGTPVVKEAYELMSKAPYNFIGNIEGRQIPFGDADVVVADGFTGNLILKTYEGVAKVLMNGIKDAFMKNTLSKLAYLGVKSGIDDMKKQFDYKEYGGAVMLGVKKPVVKAHGSADARTFKNAIKQAVWFIDNDLIETMETWFSKNLQEA